MLELALRLVASLAVVVGLLLVLARLGARRFSGGTESLVRVVHRQPLSRTSSLAVVDVAGRVLVLGATEHQVSLITELDPDALAAVDAAGLTESDDEHRTTTEPLTLASTAPSRAVPTVPTVPTVHAGSSLPAGALGGSVLSPATWQAARRAVTGRPGTPSRGQRRSGGARRAS